MAIDPNETAEHRAARFASAMTAAGAKVETGDEPAEAGAEVVPVEPTPADPAPVAEAAPVVAATPAASRWKRRIKALDEEREIDLETMPEAELDALLGKGLAHESRINHLRAQRDEAREAIESAKGSAATARDEVWIAELAEDGRTIIKDPSRPRGIRIVPLKTQTASEGGGAKGQTDLDALEKAATEENTPEAWAAAFRGLRGSIPQTMGEAEVKRIAQEMLEAGRQQSAEAESQTRRRQEFNAKFDAVKAARKADFALAGDLADHFEGSARNAALLESARQPDPENPKAFIPPTEESVFRVYHAHADSAKRAFAGRGPVVDPAKPRPKAPTVLPSGSASAAAPTDPKKIDRSTPEGKRQATAYLVKLARERGIYSGAST